MLETDKRDPTVKVVAAIARALGIDACALAFGDLLEEEQGGVEKVPKIDRSAV